MLGPATLKLAPDPVSLLFVSLKNADRSISIAAAAAAPVY
uniref:Uncharacterized protein n=1 Tax=Arundo donax TaxID=35708 RepID=A0A0A9AW93_ARUDO